MAEGKKTKSTPETARPKSASVGETLRAAREAKKLSIEDVSSSIHIRVLQLKALEDNNVSALPGMTYAIGFVRSYANFLGLNGAEISRKFKDEQGYASAPAKLNFPEPIMESRTPGPLMIGIGAFLSVALIAAWAVYSNTGNRSFKAAAKIPPAPVAKAAVSIAKPAAPAAAPLPAPAVTTALPAPTPVLAETSKQEQPPSGGLTEIKSAATVSAPEIKLEVAPVPVEEAKGKTPSAAGEVKKVPEKTLEEALTETLAAAPKEEPEAETKEESRAEAPAPVINIKRSSGRIVLRANQASWVQITDAQQKVIYRKVLRPGDQYVVPLQPGLSMVTANAGGLDVIVDGQKVQPIGGEGEIVRGIALDPAILKQHKTRVQR